MDYEAKARIRVLAVDSAIAIHAKKPVTAQKLVADAKVIHRFLTDAQPAKALKLAKDDTRGNRN